MKNNMKWINFLHIYQPPTQTKEIVEKVTKESYDLIVDLLKKYPKLKLTMNINGSLLELWQNFGFQNTITQFKALVESGRIELVGSAMYHPILPLIPAHEIKTQIILNNEISKRIFGNTYKPKGFYLPEMAYSPEVGKIIEGMGFSWIILDEIHLGKEVDQHIRYTAEGTKLSVIFRNTKISKTFPPESVIEKKLTNIPHLITAHDGEMYGHWHKEDRGYYEKAFTNHDIEFITCSEYLKELKKTKKVKIRNANWESTEEEIGADVAYSLWKNPNNEIHKELWRLAEMTSKAVAEHSKDPGIKIASNHLSRGLSSCAWWWSTERKLGPFSPIMWNPTEIERGATELIFAIRDLKNLDKNTKEKAESVFKNLKDNVWNKHWAKELQK